MKLAALDTSTINRWNNLGLNGNEFRKLLISNLFEPVVGIHTTYELGRDFLNNNTERSINLFRIISDLKPKFTRERDLLYVMELHRLKSNIPIHDVFATQRKLKLIENRIQNYCKGQFTEHEFTTVRQESWKHIQAKWNNKKVFEIENIRGISFVEFSNQVLEKKSEITK